MDLLHPASSYHGFRPLVGRSTGEFRFLDYGMLALKSGETWSQSFPGMEATLVILGGACDVQSGTKTWKGIGKRENVFAGKATSIYVPANGNLTVTACSNLDAALITADADNSGDAILIGPDDVKEKIVGVGNWRRSVQDIVDARVPAQRLLIGETYNDPGAWSSYPPHKHDTEIPDTEVELEEVYHFRIDPPQGFGFQRIYSPETGLDEVYTINNGDTVVIPRGYHPVVAAPGYRLYYLWALAGEKRIMRPNDDPTHTWVKKLQG